MLFCCGGGGGLCQKNREGRSRAPSSCLVLGNNSHMNNHMKYYIGRIHKRLKT